MNAKFYVPFETAKLLKEKGYPQGDSDMYYNQKGKLKHSDEITGIYTIAEFARYYVAAPAYCEVIDWLERRKEKYINTHIGDDNRFYCVIYNEQGGWCFTDVYYTRLEAINEAIIKALENYKS